MIARHFVIALALVFAASTNLVVPAARAQAPRPMTFLDMQQMRQVGAADAESRRQVAALYAVHAGLEGGEAADRHLPGVAPAGRGVDQADDVHEGEERNVAALGARRQLLRLPLEPRSAGERRDAQPALPDAPRRRRSAADHRCERRRVGLRVQRRRHAGSCIAAGKSGEEQLYSLPGEGIRHRGRRAAHQAPDRRRHVAVGARQHAHLLRHARHARRRREGAARQEVHRQHPQRRDAGLEPVGARPRPPKTTKRLTDGGAYSVDDFTISTTASGSASAALVAEPLQAQHHAGEPLRRSVSARSRDRHDRAADEQRRSRRERPELLARQQAGSRSRRRTISRSTG